MMKDTYHQFTSKAAEGRKMDADKIEKLAQGRIFTGRMAVENGLVDKLGTLSDAVAEAKTLAGLKADDKIDLQILPKPKNFFEQLFEGSSADTEVRSLGPRRSVGSARIARRLAASDDAPAGFCPCPARGDDAAVSDQYPVGARTSWRQPNKNSNDYAVCPAPA